MQWPRPANRRALAEESECYFNRCDSSLAVSLQRAARILSEPAEWCCRTSARVGSSSALGERQLAVNQWRSPCGVDRLCRRVEHIVGDHVLEDFCWCRIFSKRRNSPVTSAMEIRSGSYHCNSDRSGIMPDGRRKRRFASNPAKRNWYALHRARRFARRFGRA